MNPNQNNKLKEILVFCVNCKRNIPEEFSLRKEDLRVSICHQDPYYTQCMEMNGFKRVNKPSHV